MIFTGLSVKCLLGVLLLVGPVFGMDDLEVWKSSSSVVDNYRITYSEEYFPTEAKMKYFQEHGFPGERNSMYLEMYSHKKSLVKVIKQGGLRKYDSSVQQTKGNLIDAGVLQGNKGWKEREDISEATTQTGFKSLDRLKKVGSIWPEWPYARETLLDIVLLPEEPGTFTQLDDHDNAYEFTSKSGNSIRRYYLDPKNGMMPVLIEYYLPGGPSSPLFLNRYIEINKYEERDGKFIPIDAASHELVHGKKSLCNAVRHIHAEKIETNLKFEPEDFDISFPPGTQVHDHIADITYVVRKNGRTDLLRPVMTSKEKDIYLDGIVDKKSMELNGEVGSKRDGTENSTKAVKNISVANEESLKTTNTTSTPLVVSESDTRKAWLLFGIGVLTLMIVWIVIKFNANKTD